MAAASALPSKPKSRSLFYPSGPITAKHTKNREGLHRSTDEPLIWPKSGPPTHESRQFSSMDRSKTERAAPSMVSTQNKDLHAGGADQMKYPILRSRPGQEVPALLDAKHPARMAGKAIVDLRRDLNGLISQGKKGGHTVAGRLLQPGSGYQRRTKEEATQEAALDDWSDDELWESLGRPSGTSRAELKQKAIGRLVTDRCLDSSVASVALGAMAAAIAPSTAP